MMMACVRVWNSLAMHQSRAKNENVNGIFYDLHFKFLKISLTL